MMQAVTNFSVTQHHNETNTKVSLHRCLIQKENDSKTFRINWILNVYHSHSESQNIMDVEYFQCSCSRTNSPSTVSKVQDCALSLLGVGHMGLDCTEVTQEVLFYDPLNRKYTSHGSRELKDKVLKHYPITDLEKMKVSSASSAVLKKIIDIDFLVSQKLSDDG